MRVLNGFGRAAMHYWYWHTKTLNRLWPTAKAGDKELVIYPSVFKPTENEQGCVAYCTPGDVVLDLGCGSGIGALSCATVAQSIVAVDINPAAVKNAAENCQRHGVENVQFAVSDMFAQVEGRFDLILANPPYFVAGFDDAQKQAGTSLHYLPVLFSQAQNYLADKGRLLVQYPWWFRREIEALARDNGFEILSIKPLPPKSFGGVLLSMAYLQAGFRSSYFLLRRAP